MSGGQILALVALVSLFNLERLGPDEWWVDVLAGALCGLIVVGLG